MPHKSYGAKREIIDQRVLQLQRRVTFISKKTGEREDTISDLLMQYSMAAIAYGSETRSLLETSIFLTEKYICAIMHEEREIKIDKPVTKRPYRHKNKNI